MSCIGYKPEVIVTTNMINQMLQYKAYQRGKSKRNVLWQTQKKLNY
jgi:hypothetical protein